jgi:hypothetical protein
LFNLSFLLPFIFMVNAQVAIFANTLGIQGSIIVVALARLLGSSFGVITIFAHAVSIILLGSMSALGDLISVAWYLSLSGSILSQRMFFSAIIIAELLCMLLLKVVDRVGSFMRCSRNYFWLNVFIFDHLAQGRWRNGDRMLIVKMLICRVLASSRTLNKVLSVRAIC